VWQQTFHPTKQGFMTRVWRALGRSCGELGQRVPSQAGPSAVDADGVEVLSGFDSFHEVEDLTVLTYFIDLESGTIREISPAIRSISMNLSTARSRHEGVVQSIDLMAPTGRFLRAPRVTDSGAGGLG